ncbi:hypothetical protein [Mesorhizobium loti]|uniref:Uncharacterized protein n=1 Tax=Rhizobium loti TaxID=381 RepID=A0A6M7U5X6_RHILI|nr:hypothetical protein [Mesorhizobium loti]OBQ72370.1 hypothetical protein A8145_06045 [Mesorhizobium loti]QKC72026.1 hypothetical protein EB815_24915 [Mesorhizobium loti]
MSLPLKDRLGVASVTLDFLSKIMRGDDDDGQARSLANDVEYIGNRVRERLKAEEQLSLDPERTGP